MKSSLNKNVPQENVNDQVNITAFLNQFDQLKEGDTLSITMDYDLQPLYQQLLEKKGEIFSWKYVEHGPHWWKVNISKN